MTKEDALRVQLEVANWINSKFSRSFSLSGNDHISFACFDISIEHHNSICSLCVDKKYGSMYALLRVQFEAYARGLWLRHVADEKGISRYKKEKDLESSFGEMIRKIEENIGLKNGPLEAIRSNHWPLFCSFTHTGYQSILRRVTGTHTGAVNYSLEELLSALNFSGGIALASAVEMASLSEDEELIMAAMNRVKLYSVA